MGYGALKEGVTESVLSVLVPLQQKYNEIRSNKPFLNEIMQNGAQRASHVANKVLAKVQKKVGFGLKKL
ncbi:MAG: tryptophan--tRNA ligase, partial [Lachnospiraceae bacterium]